MKGMTKKQRQLFTKTFNQCVINFFNDVCEFGQNEIEVIEDTELKTFSKDEDFIDFAKQSFLHAVKLYYDENYLMEAAVQSTKSIIEFPTQESDE